MTTDRRKLKRDYKEQRPSLGVFQIRNLVSGKIFVASSLNLAAAQNRHRFQLEHGSHPSRRLQKDWTEHGPNAFVFEILDEVHPGEHDQDRDRSADLAFAEEFWLAQLEPFGDKGYNEPPISSRERLARIVRNTSPSKK